MPTPKTNVETIIQLVKKKLKAAGSAGKIKIKKGKNLNMKGKVYYTAN